MAAFDQQLRDLRTKIEAARGIDGLHTRADLEQFIRQRLFQEHREYEPWWEVGVTQQEPRTTIPFATGWSNASYIGAFNTAAFYLDREGFVHFKGGVEISNPTYTGTTFTSTVFTLPPGYIPAIVNVRPLTGQEDFDGAGGGTAATFPRQGRLIVRADGTVDVLLGGLTDGAAPYVGNKIITAWLDDLPRVV